MKLNLQFFGGRGSTGGRSGGGGKSSGENTAKGGNSARYAEDMKQEERAYISRDISRTGYSGDTKQINESLKPAPIGTVLTYESRKGSKETFEKIGEDIWNRTFKHNRGFEHLDSATPTKHTTSDVARRMFEGRKFEDHLYDVSFRRGRKK